MAVEADATQELAKQVPAALIFVSLAAFLGAIAFTALAAAVPAEGMAALAKFVGGLMFATVAGLFAAPGLFFASRLGADGPPRIIIITGTLVSVTSAAAALVLAAIGFEAGAWPLIGFALFITALDIGGIMTATGLLRQSTAPEA